ncbi:hypothetical protein [Flectobacillus longus]|uniref:hypothetical protein n=1 Tax=Flectobacillus longus TaxID=2984207 RepID=UPI0024B6BDFA|nr:hypothetical protein [Flectobacillus longus]MDI9882751.1 hypothetical protein [Flectobacillus longus]
MATFNVIGTSLISPDELFAKKFSGELSSLRSIENLNDSERNMEFMDVSIAVNTLESLQHELRSNFQEIGIGKPLSIEIATVYTGEYKKFLGGRKDAVVVSGVKNSQTFQGTSRAVNIKSEKVNENDYLEFSAFEDGTKTVFYSPAMDAESTVVSFELMFDNFDNSLFETISGLLSSAAGIPVFLPAAPYLLGGSQLVNIGSKLGDSLFSGRPHLSGTIPIEFDSPIIPPTEPREFIIYNEKDKDEFAELQVALFKNQSPQLRLINKNTNEEYKGRAPYMIVILNGAVRRDLEAFSPTIASATLLKKFYGSSGNTGDATNTLLEAMQLYNDFTYKMKADKLKKQLDPLSPDSEEYKKLKVLYNAYAANIQSENFKLLAIT